MVDIGEALLAAAGVRAVLTRDPVKIRAAERDAMLKVQQRIDAGARDLVNGSSEAVAPPELDYDGMLDQLAKPVDEAHLQALAAAFGPADGELEAAFLGQAGRALRYLQMRLPISVVQTVTTVQNVRPSDVAIGLYEDTLEVVDDPLCLYGLIGQDRLTSQLALDVMTVYPSIYAAAVQAVIERIGRRRAREAGYEPDWERSLAVMLAVPGLDPKLRAMLQTPLQPPAAPPPGPKPGEAPPSLLATPSQKLDLRN